MAASAIVVRGYGAWAGVGYAPTLGYSVPSVPPTVPGIEYAAQRKRTEYRTRAKLTEYKARCKATEYRSPGE
jgi:hypothetical protein